MQLVLRYSAAGRRKRESRGREKNKYAILEDKIIKTEEKKKKRKLFLLLSVSPPPEN